MDDVDPTHDIDIQMNQKELTETFMMILKRKNLWSPWFTQNSSVL